MNLNQLRVFAAVATELSITRAAGRLRISQPAVSKQLLELENSLGTSLVDRLPRGIRLTEAGRILEGHARRIFQSETAAEAELAELMGLARGKLAVGASTTIGNYLLPDIFGKFKAKYPQVQLELEIANTAVIQAAVREDRLDLGLTEGLAGPDGLDVSVFAHDEMVMIATPRHKVAKAKGINAKELTQMPMLMREHGSGTRDVIEAALAARGVEIEPVMSLGSTEALKKAVAAGLGSAIVSKLAVELEVRVGVLSAIKITDLEIRRALHLLTLKGKTPSAAAREFLKLVLAQAAGLPG